MTHRRGLLLASALTVFGGIASAPGGRAPVVTAWRAKPGEGGILARMLAAIEKDSR